MKYSVSYEVRQSGAIGIFEWRVFRVDADNEQAARAAAFTLAHDQGLETRSGPIIRLQS
jgi:hypothetical protein